MSEANVSPDNVDLPSPAVDKAEMISPTVTSPATVADYKAALMSPWMMETLKTCVLSGVRIDKEELKKKLTMPRYLRHAMRDCIRYQDPTAMSRQIIGEEEEEEDIVPPETPMVVFINTHSGGRHGPVLKERLKQLMSEEQVFDLTDVKPDEFLEYGLGCLEVLASLGDSCAKEVRERMRIMVAGGDGTVGWVLGCLTDLHKKGREPVPPVGIIPLGTGNDLSRSFSWAYHNPPFKTIMYTRGKVSVASLEEKMVENHLWPACDLDMYKESSWRHRRGGSFPFSWKAAINRSLLKACTGRICRLDSWRISLSMPEDTIVEAPHSLIRTEEFSLDEGLEVEGELPEEVTCYEGVFYNYFSLGMDAQVAHGFHTLRNEKPYLANGPIANKIIYSGYSCTQGWFLTPCTSDPSLRGLKNILRLHVKKFNSLEWEQIPVPSSVRAIVALNLHSYGSGRNPWGNLKPEYLEKRGFVEANVDDGLLEIFGLKQGWHASFVMVELISAKHIAQAAAIRLEIRGGEWKDAYMQMDGEPWKQPLRSEFSTFVEIKREPFQSYMIGGE